MAYCCRRTCHGNKTFRRDSHLTVTPSSAVALAKIGLLSPVPQSVIDDKAKADPITKVVVCLQAGWFVLQCAARVAQELPLSLLEIHVLAHILVALLMYFAWFGKPYNALSPLVLREAEIVEAGALFSLNRGPSSSESKCMLKGTFNQEIIARAHFGCSIRDLKQRSANANPDIASRTKHNSHISHVNPVTGTDYNQATNGVEGSLHDRNDRSDEIVLQASDIQESPSRISCSSPVSSISEHVYPQTNSHNRQPKDLSQLSAPGGEETYALTTVILAFRALDRIKSSELHLP